MRTASYEQFMSLGVLVLLDSPQHIELGFDNLSIKVGSMFKGIKMVPFGVHYLHFSLPEEKHLFKISQFIHFAQGDKIKVLKWDQHSQDFIKLKRQDQVGYIEGVKAMHFDCYLAPYENDRLKVWQETVCWINERVLGKLDPIYSIQTIEEEYGNNKKEEDKEPTTMIDEGDEQEEPIEPQPSKTTHESASRFHVMKGTIYYSEIPKKLDTGLETTTNINLDKTPVLMRVMANEYKNSPTGILGEIQYSFVSFLLGENLDSFEQWKKLINLFCYSQHAREQYLDLFLNFTIVLFNQIKQLPKDFFIDQLSKDSFLVSCLMRLQEYSSDPLTNKRLRERLCKLLEMIQSIFKYEVPLEDEDDMPTIVYDNEYL